MAAHSRLTTALTQGALTLPDGDISVVRPGAIYDVSALPRQAVQVVHSFYPDATAWSNAGFAVAQTLAKSAVAIVVVPRAKALARDMIARACTMAELVIVDGQKTDGIDSLYKDIRQSLGDVPVITKDHGRLFWFPATDAFAGWAAAAAGLGPHGFVTTAGVFSDGAVDAGSALLANALPVKLPARLADLGAGWGYLSRAILEREGVQSLDLIEAEALSLDCARANVIDPRAKFIWGDATTHKPAKGYDGVIMNPPFHAGRTADPGLGRAFIAASARVLAGHGKLWMVANRHLPYEATLREHFRNVDIIGGDKAFKLFHATRPIR